MVAGMNPWLSMWSQPRSTIRAIVHNRPTYGVFYLAAIFALHSFFFYANWWSLGLRANYYTLLLLGILLSPIIGFIWLYFIGWVYTFTGRWCRGHAPASHLRAVIAWSKIPTSINVLMWFTLILLNPDIAFIQDAGNPSSIFINFISLILAVWSFILLFQGLIEVQSFTPLRSLLNILLATFLSTIISMVAFGILRFVYIMM